MLFQIGFLYTGMLSLLQQYAGDAVVRVAEQGSVEVRFQFPVR